MATPSTAKTKDLIILAERMGIPVDEAMRQLAQRIADVESSAEEPETPDPPSSAATDPHAVPNIALG